MALFPLFRSSDESTPDDTDGWGDSPSEGGGGKMTFLEHLDELRKRLAVSLVSILVGCVIAFTFVGKIYAFIMDPLNALLPKGSGFIFTEPMEAFFLSVKMALLAGVIIAMPVILLQAWLFIAPGLYAKEKRLAVPFIVLATVGFVGGAAFAHYLLFPWMWIFFASFATDKLSFMPRIEPVFALYVKMVLAMGLVFQMPAIVYTLARIGLVTARFLIKSFKYAVLIIFIAAALITPSGDAVTMTLFAVPMVGLYFISILIAWIFGKRRAAPVGE
jgi:sec-independent protein translocase protein TatC